MVKVVLASLVIWHAVCAVPTVRVKVWVSAVPTPFVAVIVNVYVPAVVGVPVRVAVPSPMSVNKTPGGSPFWPVLDSDNCAVGNPVDLTVKVQAWPTVHVVLSALAIVGAWGT